MISNKEAAAVCVFCMVLSFCMVVFFCDITRDIHGRMLSIEEAHMNLSERVALDGDRISKLETPRFAAHYLTCPECGGEGEEGTAPMCEVGFAILQEEMKARGK
jgi:hypothetical protein